MCEVHELWVGCAVRAPHSSLGGPTAKQGSLIYSPKRKARTFPPVVVQLNEETDENLTYGLENILTLRLLFSAPS